MQGQPVPDFSLPSTAGTTFHFYPKFKRVGAQVLWISRDSLKSHESFKAKMKFPFELLAHPEEAVCEQFGVMQPGHAQEVLNFVKAL
jgi:peroxiredoxin